MAEVFGGGASRVTGGIVRSVVCYFSEFFGGWCVLGEFSWVAPVLWGVFGFGQFEAY